MATFTTRCPDCNAHIVGTLTRTGEHSGGDGPPTVTIELNLETALRAHLDTSEAHEND